MEALLRTHPDVDDAAVIGIPHAKYGEVPKAFIVTSKDKKLTEDDIKNFMKEKVSDYKQLKGITQFPATIYVKFLTISYHLITKLSKVFRFLK